MAKTKKKLKKGKLVVFLLIILFIVFGCVFMFKKKPKNVPVSVQLFNSLKDLLGNDDYDEEEYALLISKLFLTDFYDLNNKVMKSDVGGTQFVYSEYRSDFELGAIDSVYKYVQSNVYGDRKQELPIVKSIEKVDIYTDSFEYNYDIDYDAYYVTLNINYDVDLGYPSQVKLVLIHNDNKLEIAKMETL